MNKRKIVLIIIGILILLALPSFLERVYIYLTGDINIVTGRWDLVLLNSVLFLAFLVPLSFRKRIEWKSMGIYSAFIASLFIEMYGVPFAIYLSSAALSPGGAAASQEVILSFTILGQTLTMGTWEIIGSAISIIGMFIIAVAWIQLYRSKQDEELVTSGMYSYSRHPQYLGIMLIAVGWFVHWPSILTIGMLPVLVYFYYNLAVDEEKEVMENLENENKYKEYMESTPRFI